MWNIQGRECAALSSYFGFSQFQWTIVWMLSTINSYSCRVHSYLIGTFTQMSQKLSFHGGSGRSSSLAQLPTRRSSIIVYLSKLVVSLAFTNHCRNELSNRHCAAFEYNFGLSIITYVSERSQLVSWSRTSVKSWRPSAIVKPTNANSHLHTPTLFTKHCSQTNSHSRRLKSL